MIPHIMPWAIDGGNALNRAIISNINLPPDLLFYEKNGSEKLPSRI
jgi:hypothetical protein